MATVNPISSIKLFRRLLAYSFRYWPAFLTSVLAMAAAAAAETAFPALMKTLMDDGFSRSEDFNIWWVPVVILGIFLARGTASFVANYAMYWLSQNVLRDVREVMFTKLLELPSKSFDESSAGALISKLVTDAQQVLMAATNVITTLVRDSLILIGLMFWLLWINWKLTLVVLLLLPPIALLTKTFSDRMRQVSRNYLSTISDMTSTVEEAISGNRVVKVFGGEHYELKKFAAINAAHRAQGMRVAVSSALQSPVTQFIASIGVAAVITIALAQTRSGAATIGDFVSFVTAMIMMLNPLRHLADINSQLQRGLAAAEGVFEFLDQKPEMDQGTIQSPPIVGVIRFENVSFTYKGRDLPALDRINLEIPAGRVTALVGPSGSGKSTLINLIPRLYDVADGRVTIDGKDVREYKLAALRASIAVVSQDITLFNDSILTNVAYGIQNPDLTRVIEAVELADLRRFIDSLPEGINTTVGGRGVRLSGGQRQRIAIARAILKNAPILILDEATSALDTISEIAIQDALNTLKKNKTTIVVAHRLSTVITADQIVVMNHGTIEQNGTHDNLISSSGTYRDLYSSFS